MSGRPSCQMYPGNKSVTRWPHEHPMEGCPGCEYDKANTPTPDAGVSAEELAERERFWASVPQHDPPLVPDFERRLIAAYNAERQARQAAEQMVDRWKASWDEAQAERDALRERVAALEGARFQAFFAAMTEHAPAGDRFKNGTDLHVWVAVLTEEVGKLARASNKLFIIPDGSAYDGPRKQWSNEVIHRLLTIATVAARADEMYRANREREDGE